MNSIRLFQQMYLAPDGSLYAADQDPRAAGPSRTPSPSPRSLPRPMATDSSASSFDDEPTPHAQQQQSYAQQQQQQPRQLHHPQQQQQQSPYLTPNHNTSRPALSSPQPQYQAESFYSGGVQPGGVYYDSQRSHSQLALNVYGSGPRINEQPPTPRVPGTIPAARPAPHGPRAPVSHSRTPSPDLVIQQQLQQQQQQQPPPQLQPQQLQPQQQRELRSPATLAAGAVGLNMGEYYAYC